MPEESAFPIFVALTAALGACMGSFLNVVAHRSIEGRPWWGKERSTCEACGHILTPCELIPILSWFFQRGRCRSCGASLSPRYLLVELIGAAGAAGVAWRWGPSWAGVLVLFAFFSLLLNALTDFESGDVFDAFALAPGAVGMLLRCAGGREALLDGLAGAAVGWGAFAAIILITVLILSREGMGWGDAFFMGGMGAVMGWKLTLLAFYLGIMVGGFGIVLLMLLGRVRWGRGDAVPLVPYLAVGCYLTLLWGPQILSFIGQRFPNPAAFLPSWPF